MENVKRGNNIEKHNLSSVVIKHELQLFCIMGIGIPKNRLDETLMKFGDIRNITVELKP